MPNPAPEPLARVLKPALVRAGDALGAYRTVDGGSALISSHSPAGKRAGRSLRAKVVIYSFKLGQWLRGQVDERNQKREVQEAAQREQWRLHMAGTVWKDMLMTDLPLIEANAFDQLVGGSASNGVVPVLTVEALKAEQQMMHEISDRWRGYMDRIKHLELGLYYGAQGYQDPEQLAQLQSSREEIAELNAKMQADLEAVVAHECNPANWNLTAEQTALLPDAWRERFERKMEYEAAPTVWREELVALKEEMAAEAGSLYEYGPEVPPEDQRTTDAPTYGPARGGGPLPGP